MHGAGNDFIMVDDRTRVFPIEDQEFIKRIASRRTGIGCDGIILLQSSETADLRMRFINPDGHEQDMCGNGARCFARLAFDLGAVSKIMTIETGAGVVHAEVLGEIIRIGLTDPKDWRLGLDVGLEQTVDVVNTGVPHVVVRVKELAGLELPSLGHRIRHHELFAPEGANVNFIKVEADGSLSIRTYERGVEAETLACGTGAAAAAVVAEKQGWVELPVAVHCAGGYDLTLDFGSRGVMLSGVATTVFEGKIKYGNRI